MTKAVQLARELVEMTAAPRTCQCDFCTGVKKSSDNWCARCGDVQMPPPKWWENEDVCDGCEAGMAKDCKLTAPGVAGEEQ